MTCIVCMALQYTIQPACQCMQCGRSAPCATGSRVPPAPSPCTTFSHILLSGSRQKTHYALQCATPAQKGRSPLPRTSVCPRKPSSVCTPCAGSTVTVAAAEHCFGIKVCMGHCMAADRQLGPGKPVLVYRCVDHLSIPLNFLKQFHSIG
jgi:hypothetical protein